MSERFKGFRDHHAAYGNRRFQGGGLPPPADVSPTIGVEPLSEGRNLHLPKPVALTVAAGLTAAGGFLGLGCEPKATGGAESPPVPTRPAITTPIEIPTVTPTATATAEARKPTATSTPERLDFAPYGVYRGNLAEGGGIMISFLPDGTLFYVNFIKTKQISDARRIKPRLFRERSPGSFSFSLANLVSMTGSLEGPKISGKLEIGVPDPTSPVGEIFTTDFMAELKGTGKGYAVREFGILYKEAGGRTLTDSEAQQLLEQMCRCELP